MLRNMKLLPKIDSWWGGNREVYKIIDGLEEMRGKAVSQR